MGEAGSRVLAAGCAVKAEASKQPLCLLTSDMQNRRIVDRAFMQPVFSVICATPDQNGAAIPISAFLKSAGLRAQ
jgi:hypothetical protein